MLPAQNSRATPLLAMLLTSLPALAHASPPPPTCAPPSAVELRLDTSRLEPELGLRLDRELGEQLGPELDAAGVKLIDAEVEGGVVLQVRFEDFDAEQRNYEVELEVSGGQALAQVERLACEACSERRLVTAIVELAPILLARYAMPPQPAEAAPAQEQPRSERRPSARPEREPSRERSVFTPVGATLLGLGVGAGAAGAYLFGRGIEYDLSNPGAHRRPYVDYQISGIALIGAGAAVLSAGAALLIVESRRRRSGPRMNAQLSRDYFGFSFQHQF